MRRRRGLLIIILGIVFLSAITFIGTSLESLIPHRPSAPTQTTESGPYRVTLQVMPNPPAITQTTTLSIQIVRKSTQQLVTNAHVVFYSTMEIMDMGTERIDVQLQSDGSYRGQVQFDMSGPWQVRVAITVPGSADESATFQVTTQ